MKSWGMSLKSVWNIFSCSSSSKSSKETHLQCSSEAKVKSSFKLLARSQRPMPFSPQPNSSYPSSSVRKKTAPLTKSREIARTNPAAVSTSNWANDSSLMRTCYSQMCSATEVVARRMTSYSTQKAMMLKKFHLSSRLILLSSEHLNTQWEEVSSNEHGQG